VTIFAFLASESFYFVSGPALTPHDVSLQSVRLAFAHWRALTHLETMLTSELLQTRSRYPATVDQAFLALAVEFVVRRSPRFGRLFRIARPIYHLCRTALSFALLFHCCCLALLER